MSIDLVTLEDRFRIPSGKRQGLSGCGCGCGKRRGRNENNNINVINIGGTQGSPAVTDNRSRANLAVSSIAPTGTPASPQAPPSRPLTVAPPPVQPRAVTYGIAPPATGDKEPFHIRPGYCCPLNIQLRKAFQ